MKVENKATQQTPDTNGELYNKKKPKKKTTTTKSVNTTGRRDGNRELVSSSPIPWDC